MTFDPQKPRFTITLANKSYEVEGSFAVLEAAENALKDHLFNILTRCFTMSASDMAKLLSAILQANGERITPREIGEILWDTVGVVGDDYTKLCLEVYAFLNISVSRPADREKKSAEMEILLKKAREKAPSLGSTTDSLPSAS